MAAGSIEFGQLVKACLLGQAAASVMGREAVGSTHRRNSGPSARTCGAMLKEGGEPPTGRWADLAVLQPVKDHKARHASTLLVFDAVERALAEIEARAGCAGGCRCGLTTDLSSVWIRQGRPACR